MERIKKAGRDSAVKTPQPSLSRCVFGGRSPWNAASDLAENHDPAVPAEGKVDRLLELKVGGESSGEPLPFGRPENQPAVPEEEGRLAKAFCDSDRARGRRVESPAREVLDPSRQDPGVRNRGRPLDMPEERDAFVPRLDPGHVQVRADDRERHAREPAAGSDVRHAGADRKESPAGQRLRCVPDELPRRKPPGQVDAGAPPVELREKTREPIELGIRRHRQREAGELDLEESPERVRRERFARVRHGRR
jgi:hypothetical protein